jgi:hypothetical protein
VSRERIQETENRRQKSGDRSQNSEEMIPDSGILSRSDEVLTVEE